MNFLISDTFTDSLARLTGDEQKAAKTTAFDLQMNPAGNGMSFHKLDKAKDKHFWSVRVSGDLRIIVHKTAGSLLLCYVDHHDKAYAWAERRKLETHPATGAAQLVEIREKVTEILVPVYVHEETPVPPKPALFARHTDGELLGYGVPAEWLDDVRQATEDTLLLLADRLPAEAAEALLELATGGKPRVAKPETPAADPFEHPDAQRRFRVMTNLEELQRAMESPWDKWAVFLHPEQREWVGRAFGGPARVSGSAGTGKTIVALHRVAHLARTHADARVLLTTYNDALARALQGRLTRLIGNEPRLGERIEVMSLDAAGLRLHRAAIGEPQTASREAVRDAVRGAAAAHAGHGFPDIFLMAEWDHVVDAWQLDSWEGYRDVPRLGRRTRLAEAKRRTLWAIYEQARGTLDARGLVTRAALFTRLARHHAQVGTRPYDFIVVDEAQDLGIAELRFFAAIGGGRPDSLFFAADAGQRIFQQPFSWKSLGVDIRGRSRTLRVNYRTSHQIRATADRLLGSEVSDADGNREARQDTVSVFNGPAPVIRICESEEEEGRLLSGWLGELQRDGILPHETGVFVRSRSQLHRATTVLEACGQPWVMLDDGGDPTSGRVCVCTMHLAKGLEFRATAVIACDDEVLPLQQRIEQVGDGGDLEEIYQSERQLLYVACTRARDRLLVTAADPASEFLDDLAYAGGALPGGRASSAVG
jgi:superfamily I DNA/RNA helicase